MFARLRWLSVLLPVLLIGIVETLSDSVLDPYLGFPLDTIMVMLVVLASATIFSVLTFREIGHLTRAIEVRSAELERRDAVVRALQDVTMRVAAAGALAPLLETIVERARVLLGTDVAVLWIDSPGHPIRMASGFDAAAGLAAGEPEADTTPEAWLAHSGFDARLASPLRQGRDTIGVLCVADRGARSFDVPDVEALGALATIAAIAVENDRLHGSLRELAVRAERERVAREMHDGLAQVLGYVNTKAAAVTELLAAGRTTEAVEQLEQLSAAARSTYVDVREAILGLSMPISAEAGLTGAIEEYGRRFAEASKLAVDVESSPAARAAQLAPEADAQAFRIVQEALTNIRKHALAGRVRIVLAAAGGSLVVTVDDDGRGLGQDVGGASDWPHYGLATMSARAAAVGGTVTWARSPLGGTRVEIHVPEGRAGRPGLTIPATLTAPLPAPGTPAVAGVEPVATSR